jgi:hypothetical protein
MGVYESVGSGRQRQAREHIQTVSGMFRFKRSLISCYCKSSGKLMCATPQ